MAAPRILILSASSGAGHVKAAQALEQALKERYPGAEVINVDSLQYTSPLFRHVYSRTYLDMINKAPVVLGILYDHFDSPGKAEVSRLALDQMNSWPLLYQIKKIDPDLIISTHFLPSELVSLMQARGQLRCQQVVVVTDFDVHAMWLTKNAAHYFVALEETAKHLEKMGVDPDKVSISGIPVDPRFAEPYDQKATRKELGLLPDVTTILLSAGGFGVGPVSEMLNGLLELSHPAQVLVMCGRNSLLKERVQKLAATAPGHIKLHGIGYTNEMHKYMGASDLMLGKPGGLTTSEALCRDLAFVVVSPIPGQEERNADHLLEQGIAIRCNNLPILAYKIDRLLSDPAKVQLMKDNAAKLAKPNAAADIAESVCELIDSCEPAQKPKRRFKKVLDGMKRTRRIWRKNRTVS